MSIRFLKILMLCTACLTVTLSLSACRFPPRLYKIDVRQGNFITAERVSKLKLGLSKSMVQDMMGTPAIMHFFEPNRWDYYYYLRPGNGGPIKEKRVTVYFKADRVANIEMAGVRVVETESAVETESY